MEKRKILLVEDDGIVARDLQQVLARLGYEVPAALSSGEEALRWAGSHTPDLVLMDIMLKGELDGIETAKRLNLSFQVPVIYLTAYADGEILERAKRSEPLGYILKPYDETELKTTIEMGLYRAYIDRNLKREYRKLTSQVQQNATELAAAYEALQTELAERQRAEIARRSSEELFHKAFFCSPSPMAICSCPGLAVIKVNESWSDTFGYTAEEAEGKTLPELGLREENESSARQLRQLLVNNARIKNLETKLYNRAGSSLHMLLSVERITYGYRNGYLVVYTDLTERYRLQKEMARLERLNLVGEMAAGMGHEVRNPLTSVRGFLQLMSAKPEFTEHQKYFRIMIAELDRANDIITEFISLAKDKVVELKLQDLNDLLEDILPLIQADALLAEKHLIYELGNLPPLLLNTKEISQMVMNLCRNGLEAMDKGGELILRTHSPGEGAIMEITDHGPGIPPELLDKIGTPFFTTKEKGTGLGLAVCYSNANHHHAAIEIDTGAGGTTFRVKFPPPSAVEKLKTDRLNSLQ